MRILHYGLGFPPYRTGGLIKYTLDLMDEQSKQDEVFYLYPGKLNCLKKNAYIKKSLGKHTDYRIETYELVNSLPLPLVGGISDPKKFMVPVKISVYIDFLDRIKPDIIHVHTLMGLHKEFFEAAKKKSIKIIFTTHDYFGISPNPNFFFKGKSWDEENQIEYWMSVGLEDSLSEKKLRIFQLSIYPLLRKYLKKLKNKNQSKNLKNEIYKLPNFEDNILKKDFEQLQKYYQSIFSLIDKFHFNSSISKKVFEKNLWEFPTENKIITITNASVNNSEINIKKSTIKNITYIGPYNEMKGFQKFLKLVEQDFKNKYQFQVWGDDNDINLPKRIINNGRFTDKERKKVFLTSDLVIIPSLCKETFGFLTIESLSYNVPVLVSNTVGSKDILEDKFIYSDNLTLDCIPTSVYISLNLKTMKTHVKEIKEFYNKK